MFSITLEAGIQYLCQARNASRACGGSRLFAATVYAYDQLKIRLYIYVLYIMRARDTSRRRRRRAYLQVSAWYCLDKRSLLGATSTILAVDSFEVDGKYSIYLHDIFHLYSGMTCSAAY
jgi:hypothetical protein